MNPYLIIGIIGAVFLSGLGGGFIGWHERAVRVPAELAKQAGVDQQECEKAQQLTKDANDALQKDRDNIRTQLSALKLRHPSTCVRPAGSSQLPSGAGQHANADGTGAGINTDWLRDYAARAEEYRTEVNECSTFLQNERKLLNHPAQN